MYSAGMQAFPAWQQGFHGSGQHPPKAAQLMFGLLAKLYLMVGWSRALAAWTSWPQSQPAPEQAPTGWSPTHQILHSMPVHIQPASQPASHLEGAAQPWHARASSSRRACWHGTLHTMILFARCG